MLQAEPGTEEAHDAAHTISQAGSVVNRVRVFSIINMTTQDQLDR